MYPTIQQGDHIIINKLAYGLCIPTGSRLFIQWSTPKPGDIVIYMYQNNIIVKRVAAVGNTPLEYSKDYGYNLTIGETSYHLTEEQYHMIRYSSIVPENTILAVGDNQDESIDSRNYGFIPTNNILGRIINK